MTKWVNVEKDTWTKVADGQCTLQKNRPIDALIYIGTDEPGDGSAYGVWRGMEEFSYGGDESIFVKSPFDLRVTVFQ